MRLAWFSVAEPARPVSAVPLMIPAVWSSDPLPAKLSPLKVSRLTRPPVTFAFSVMLGDAESVEDSDTSTGAVTGPSTLSVPAVCSSALVWALSPLVADMRLLAALRSIAEPVAPMVPTEMAPT